MKVFGMSNHQLRQCLGLPTKRVQLALTQQAHMLVDSRMEITFCSNNAHLLSDKCVSNLVRRLSQ